MLFCHLLLTVWSLGQAAVVQSNRDAGESPQSCSKDYLRLKGHVERRLPKDSQMADSGIHLQGKTLPC